MYSLINFDMCVNHETISIIKVLNRISTSGTKNSLQGISRLELAEQSVNLKQLIEMMQSKEQENKMTKMSKEMWDTVKQNNLCVIEQDRELGAEKFGGE